MKRNFLFLSVMAALMLIGLTAYGMAPPDLMAVGAHSLMPHTLSFASPDMLGTTLMGVGSMVASTVSNKKIRDLQARKSKHVTDMRALNDKASLEKREPTAEEATQFDALNAQLQSIDAAISREQLVANAELSMGGTALEVADGAHITATERQAEDPKRGFRSVGEFYKAVARAGVGAGLDQRLTINAAAPTTFSNEGAGQDGGFAIPPQFSQDLWRLSLGEESLLPKTANTEITGNSMIFPKDESTPWGGSGANVYWQAEAVAAGQSKVAMGTQAMVLHKLMGLVPVTNELVEDGFAIGSYLTPLLSDRITYKVNEAILFGTGVGQPLGALTNAGNTGSPAIVQAKESAQATLTLDPKNISKMVSRLLVGELKNSVWIAIPDILPILESLTVGQFPVYLPNTNLSESPYGMLKGRPLLLSEHAAAFSSQSDISLLSLRGYRTITKAGGIQTDTSMHLFFDADATAMRIRFRMNGMPILGAPVTPPKSNVTRSHFVTLQAR